MITTTEILSAIIVYGVSHATWAAMSHFATKSVEFMKTDRHVAMFEHGFYQHVLRPFECRVGRCRKMTIN